jgi:hypothetical protein
MRIPSKDDLRLWGLRTVDEWENDWQEAEASQGWLTVLWVVTVALSLLFFKAVVLDALLGWETAGGRWVDARSPGAVLLLGMGLTFTLWLLATVPLEYVKRYRARRRLRDEEEEKLCAWALIQREDPPVEVILFFYRRGHFVRWMTLAASSGWWVAVQTTFRSFLCGRLVIPNPLLVQVDGDPTVLRKDFRWLGMLGAKLGEEERVTVPHDLFFDAVAQMKVSSTPPSPGVGKVRARWWREEP